MNAPVPVSLKRCRSYDTAEVEAAVRQAIDATPGFQAWKQLNEK